MNTSTPKTLSDLRYQDNVITVEPGKGPDATANRFFHELFSNTDPVTVNLLFGEDGKVVYEAYQDSGSIEYLYLITQQ